MDPLDRLQSRRNGGIPTLSLLVGPLGLGLERWQRWARYQGRAVARAAGPEELDSAWLRAASLHDLVGAAAGTLGRAVQQAPEVLSRMTPHELDRLKDLPRERAASRSIRASRALLQDRGLGPRLTRSLAPEEVVPAVAELLEPGQWPAWLVAVPTGRPLARTLSALEPRMALCPRLPAAVVVSMEAFSAFASQERGTSRLLTMAREGWVAVEGLTEQQLAQQLQRLQPRPAAAAIERLVSDGVSENLCESYLRAATAVRQQPRDEGQARSTAEQFLFDRLESLPETAGQFVLNAPLEFLHGRAPAEADLLARAHRLVIEVDGAAFHLDPEQYRRDRRKDWLLQQHGYRIYRVLAEDVVDRLGEILDTVCQALAPRS